MAWTNEDGLLVRFNKERSTPVTDGTDNGQGERVFEIQIDSQDLPALTDINDDRPHLPANALITDALLITTTGFTGTGTLSIGLGDSSQTAIDADGIDAAIDVDVALAAAGDVVACDGALADKTATVGAADAWVYATVSGTVSAGVATLKVKYVV